MSTNPRVSRPNPSMTTPTTPTSSESLGLNLADRSSTPAAPIKISDSTTHAPLSEFPLFPKLPIELRLVIWELAFPATRVVVVYLGYSRQGPISTPISSFGIHQAPVPTPRAACPAFDMPRVQEYLLATYNTHITLHREYSTSPKWRFSSVRDIVFVPCPDTIADLAYNSIQDSTSIKRLVLPFFYFTHAGGYEATRLLKAYRTLEEVILLAWTVRSSLIEVVKSAPVNSDVMETWSLKEGTQGTETLDPTTFNDRETKLRFQTVTINSRSDLGTRKAKDSSPFNPDLVSYMGGTSWATVEACLRESFL